ncbi:MAG: lactonase family protein [Oscillospiraceae bacterium]|jgi:6-phosphogluconolactonase
MKNYIACIGTAAVRGSRGIYSLEVDVDDGRMRVISSAKSFNSGYVVFSPDRRYVYSTQECMTFSGRASGGAAAYSMDDCGNLTFINSVNTGGQLPCHISINLDGSELYISSYLNGCVSVHRIQDDGSIGGVYKVIQHPVYHGIRPSIHCSTVTEDGRFLCSLNVTAHVISFYDIKSGNYDEVSRFEFDPPYNKRPRQIVFTADSAYLLTEFGKEAVVFDYDPDSADFLKVKQVKLLYPSGPELPKSAASCIKLSPDRKCLACSVRGYNLITIFRIGEDGTLSEPVFNKIKGKTPRDFSFTPEGKHILVGAQQSDTMELYSLNDDGTMELMSGDLHLPSCFCVAFR